MIRPAHYPPVMQPLLSEAYKRTENDPRKRAEVMRLATKMNKDPVFNYRALPQALRFHQSTKRFRFCLGGNRSSKSHSLAQEVIWFATGTHPWKQIVTPNVGWYCTLTWELCGTILWDKLHRLLTHTKHRVAWRNRGKGIPSSVSVWTSNGWSTIIFKAYEQGREAFQGVERLYIANDEQFPQDVWLEQISRIGENPLYFFTAMTPIKAQPWLEPRLTTEIPDTWDKFEYPLDDNRVSRGGFLPDNEIDALIEEWPEEVQPTRRMGKWASFLGAVYKTFNRGVHMVSEDEERRIYFKGEQVPPEILAVGGIDWGGNNPFVFLWACQIPWLDGEWYIFDEYYWSYRSRGVRLLREHANLIKERTWRTWNTSLKHTWADHDTQDRYEFEDAGIGTDPADKKDVVEGIETVQRMLKVSKHTSRPRLHIAERCRMTLTQMATYSWPEGTETRDPADVPMKVEDHCPDVVRYIIHSEAQSLPSGRPVEMPKEFSRRF